KQEAGFQKVLIKPDLYSGLHYVKGQYDSIWGPISVDWKITGRKAELALVLPPNVTATVLFGSKRFDNITHDFRVQVNL
ncbi:alpha-L-rhamnosidase C-terminal domain-containing protein, partial [Streptococcus caledonicus]